MKKSLLAVLAIVSAFVLPKLLVGAAAGLSIANMFNFGDVNFNAQETRDFGDVLIKETFAPENNAFKSIYTVRTDKKNGDQLLDANEISKITKLDQGAGQGATSKAIDFSQQILEMRRVKAWLQLDSRELDDTMAEYYTATGISKDDIIGNGPEIVKFLTYLIGNALQEDAMRIFLFNQKNHTAVGAGSGSQLLTAGTAVGDYNIINGIFQRMNAIAPLQDSPRRVYIPENAEDNYDDQMNLAPDRARTVYRDLLTKAHPQLKNAARKIIGSTSTLFNNYADWLENQSGVDASFSRNEAGFNVIKRRNVEVIELPFLDRTIQADFDDGDKYHVPHRAFLIDPSDIQMFVDTEAGFENLELWYSQDFELNNFRAKYQIGAAIRNANKIQYAS